MGAGGIACPTKFFNRNISNRDDRAGTNLNEKMKEHRASSWVRASWWLTVFVAVGIFFASLPGYGVWLSGAQGVVESSPLSRVAFWISLAASFSATLISIGLAALLFWRKPNDRMALYTSFYLLGYGALMAGPLEALSFALVGSARPAIGLQGIFFTLPTTWLFCLFPNGRFEPEWTRRLAWFWVILSPTLIVAPPYDSMFFGAPAPPIFVALVALIWIGAFFMLIYAQILRYRKFSSTAEKLQTKWVVFAIGTWIGFLFLQTIPYYYLENLPVESVQPWWAPLSGAVWWLSLNIIPISLTLAILRNRLFEIDIIIRRTLVYGILTSVLAILYYGLIYLTSALRNVVFQSVIGQPLSEIGIVVSTLIGAALFSPLRARVQNAIDRAFYRKKYDAARVLAQFAQTARDEVELSKLSERLIGVVEETMQPTQVGLWLKQSK